MIKQLTTTLTFFTIILCYGQQISVSGTVFDKNTGVGVPFATIHIYGTSIGTCANLEGDFQLKIPDSHMNGILMVSSMGYELVELQINQSASESIKVSLIQSIVDLGTVTIRPISPEDYIREAVRRLPSNYGKQFSSNAYFRQLTLDNGNAMQFSEGFMLAYFEDFLNDTSAIEQRLLLHQTEEDLDIMAFRKKKREKKMNKAKKKAAKDGIVLDEDSLRRKAGKVGIGIATPDLMMDQDPVRQIESFLDTTKFKNYQFQFEDDIIYRGRRVNVISFKSRGKVKLKNVGLKGYLDGVIYFDEESYAVIGVDYNSEMVIPLAVRPILYVAGFGASNPKMTNKVRYLKVGDYWFPQSIQVEMEIDLTQRYWFKRNEKSSLDMEVLMAISNINVLSPESIPETFRFSQKKKIEEQVYPLEDSTWDDVNRIVLEEIK